MRISELTIRDFEPTAREICNLCGYPLLNEEKLRVLYNFLAYNHGKNDINDLVQAFNAFAAGRLSEKHESAKSLTGYSASRILNAYLREKTSREDSVTQAEKDRSFLTDENRDLIRKEFSRDLMYNDQLTDDEKNYLMGYWVAESQEQYKLTGNMTLITVASFEYLVRTGTIRIEKGILQINRNGWADLMPWDEVLRNSIELKKAEDATLMKSKQGNLRAMLEKQAGVNHEDAAKRYAVALYWGNGG